MKKETEESKIIKELRASTGLSQLKFGKLYSIPPMNIANWEQGIAKPPEYVVCMLKRLIEIDPKVPRKTSQLDPQS